MMKSSRRAARCLLHVTMRRAQRRARGGGASRRGLPPAQPARASPLWQCAQHHGKELREAGRFQCAVEERTIERFLQCGDPHHGFARIYCDACGHDYLLAFSCKTRYFCPSCHQKRVLLLVELGLGQNG